MKGWEEYVSVKYDDNDEDEDDDNDNDEDNDDDEDDHPHPHPHHHRHSLHHTHTHTLGVRLFLQKPCCYNTTLDTNYISWCLPVMNTSACTALPRRRVYVYIIVLGRDTLVVVRPLGTYRGACVTKRIRPYAHTYTRTHAKSPDTHTHNLHVYAFFLWCTTG